MSDIFHKNDSKIKPKTRGEAGFEFGTSETLQSQDLTDGFYEIPATLEPRGSAAKVRPFSPPLSSPPYICILTPPAIFLKGNA